MMHVVQCEHCAWLISAWNGAIPATQCRSPPSSGCGAHGLQVHAAGPLHNLLPATVATLFVSSLGDNSDGQGKKLTDIHRLGHFTHLIIKILC